MRGVPCPECKAEAMQKCRDTRGRDRTALHADRWAAYRLITQRAINERENTKWQDTSTRH